MDPNSPEEIPDENETLNKEIDPAEVMVAISDAMEAYFKGDGAFNLDLEKVRLRIYLKGPKWLGVVDRPVAEFVLQLEKQLTIEIEKLGIKLPKWERGMIALEVDEGSWEGLLGYSLEAIAYFKTLAVANQTTVVGVVVAAVGALSSIRRRIDETTPQESQKARDLATELDQQDAFTEIETDHATEAPPPEVSPVGLKEIEPEKVEALERLTMIQADSHQLQRPIRTLLGHMEATDTVVLPAESGPLKLAGAIETLERAARASRKKRLTYYVDHPYIVENLNTENANKWKVKIRFGTKSFPANVSLSDTDLPKLLKAYNDAFGKGQVVCDLQVTAEFDAKGEPKAAIVVGWGKPRDRSVKLSEAMNLGKNAPGPVGV